MRFVDEIINICNNNKDKRIGMFVDMDGVIADYDADGHIFISQNIPKTFFNKRPINTTINIIRELSNIDNLELYIISACLYNNQKDDKNEWLDKYAPFFKKENRYFVVKEIVNYTMETKPSIKVGYIKKIMDKDNLDLCIYIEDEHSMLREARITLKDKSIRYHVSSLID